MNALLKDIWKTHRLTYQSCFQEAVMERRCRVDRGSLIGNVLCEERPIRREEASPAYSWEKNVLGRK